MNQLKIHIKTIHLNYTVRKGTRSPTFQYKHWAASFIDLLIWITIAKKKKIPNHSTFNSIFIQLVFSLINQNSVSNGQMVSKFGEWDKNENIFFHINFNLIIIYRWDRQKKNPITTAIRLNLVRKCCYYLNKYSSYYDEMHIHTEVKTNGLF